MPTFKLGPFAPKRQRWSQVIIRPDPVSFKLISHGLSSESDTVHLVTPNGEKVGGVTLSMVQDFWDQADTALSLSAITADISHHIERVFCAPKTDMEKVRLPEDRKNEILVEPVLGKETILDVGTFRIKATVTKVAFDKNKGFKTFVLCVEATRKS